MTRYALGADLLNSLCDHWGMSRRVYAMRIDIDCKSVATVATFERLTDGETVVELFRLTGVERLARLESQPSLLFGDFDEWFKWALKHSDEVTGRPHWVWGEASRHFGPARG